MCGVENSSGYPYQAILQSKESFLFEILPATATKHPGRFIISEATYEGFMQQAGTQEYLYFLSLLKPGSIVPSNLKSV
jgi:hypothetical protein